MQSGPNHIIPVHDTPFFDRSAGYAVSLPALGRSLGQLEGHDLDPSWDSGLVRRCVAAWAVPMRALTCAQVRVLTGQKLGLTWLAEPVAMFATRFPAMEVDLYPGDLTLAALRAFPDLLCIAPVSAHGLADANYGWMEEHYGKNDPGLLVDAQALVNAARALID